MTGVFLSHGQRGKNWNEIGKLNFFIQNSWLPSLETNNFWFNISLALQWTVVKTSFTGGTWQLGGQSKQAEKCEPKLFIVVCNYDFLVCKQNTGVLKEQCVYCKWWHVRFVTCRPALLFSRDGAAFTTNKGFQITYNFPVWETPQ